MIFLLQDLDGEVFNGMGGIPAKLSDPEYWVCPFVCDRSRPVTCARSRPGMCGWSRSGACARLLEFDASLFLIFVLPTLKYIVISVMIKPKCF